MLACKTFEEVKTSCEAIHRNVEQYPVSICIPASDASHIDQISRYLLRAMKDIEHFN